MALLGVGIAVELVVKEGRQKKRIMGLNMLIE